MVSQPEPVPRLPRPLCCSPASTNPPESPATPRRRRPPRGAPRRWPVPRSRSRPRSADTHHRGPERPGTPRPVGSGRPAPSPRSPAARHRGSIPCTCTSPRRRRRTSSGVACPRVPVPFLFPLEYAVCDHSGAKQLVGGFSSRHGDSAFVTCCFHLESVRGAPLRWVSVVDIVPQGGVLWPVWREACIQYW